MRTIFLSLLLAVFFSVAAQEPLYVAAKSGLSIREKPEIGAKVLDKIPYGTKITLLNDEEEKKSIVTEGMTGYWSKVKYKNSTDISLTLIYCPGRRLNLLLLKR